MVAAGDYSPLPLSLFSFRDFFSGSSGNPQIMLLYISASSRAHFPIHCFVPNQRGLFPPLPKIERFT